MGIDSSVNIYSVFGWVLNPVRGTGEPDSIISPLPVIRGSLFAPGTFDGPAEMKEPAWPAHCVSVWVTCDQTRAWASRWTGCSQREIGVLISVSISVLHPPLWFLMPAPGQAVVWDVHSGKSECSSLYPSVTVLSYASAWASRWMGCSQRNSVLISICHLQVSQSVMTRSGLRRFI